MNDPSWGETATWVGIAIAVGAAVYLAVFRKVERGPSMRPLAVALAVIAGLAVVVVAIWTTVGGDGGRVEELDRRLRAIERAAPGYDFWYCRFDAPTEVEQTCTRDAASCTENAGIFGSACVVSTVAWCEGDLPDHGRCFLSRWVCIKDGRECHPVAVRQ